MALPSSSFGPVQPFGRAQDDARPCGTTEVAGPRSFLDVCDLVEDLVDASRHRLVHFSGLGSFDEPRSMAVALEQLAQLALRYARQHGRVGDLVAVEVEDRQDASVPSRVEELVRVP